MEKADLNIELINEIVCKVKSEGLFDTFRRECLADVDTKPAYQNLLNRVESSVSSILDEEEWNSKVNKNHVREKLRKLIAEKKFFEAGIERIVDQVVNPKLTMNFVPKIEDVAYKFLGVDRPMLKDKLMIEIDTEVLLPVYDLEQVSPDSEHSQSNESHNHSSHHIFDFKNDDLESPAFEPIKSIYSKLDSSKDKKFNDNENEVNEENDDDEMDISDDDDMPQQSVMPNIDEAKSNVSSISGLTSNTSNCSRDSSYKCFDHKQTDLKGTAIGDCDKNVSAKIPQSTSMMIPSTEIIAESNDDKYPDSTLSQVSSTSRLSIVTNNTNNETTDPEFNSNHMKLPETSVTSSSNQNIELTCPYSISEEAQMQKFNENSSSSENMVNPTEHNLIEKSENRFHSETLTNFDISRAGIKFEGTGRNFFDVNSSSESNSSKKKIRVESDVEPHKLSSNEEINDDKQKQTIIVTKAVLNMDEHLGRSEVTRLNKDESGKIYQKPQQESENDADLKEEYRETIHSMKEENGEIMVMGHGSTSESTLLNVSREVKVDKSLKNRKLVGNQTPDDHFTHKGKPLGRQRSHSKDSNDGSTVTNISSSIQKNSTDVEKQSTQNVSNEYNSNVSQPVSEKCMTQTSSSHHQNIAEFNEKMGTPQQQPIVIDQILTVSELDLESFIGENKDDPIVTSIEKTLETKMILPKMAANVFEAKKLTKIRRQIDLSNQKKIEKATVMAKRYIREKESNIRNESQGIELQFICVENQNETLLSTSSKMADFNHKNSNFQRETSPTDSKDEMNSVIADDKNLNADATLVESVKSIFNGFTASEEMTANIHHQNLVEMISKTSKKRKFKQKDVKVDTNTVGEDGKKSFDGHQTSSKTFRKRKFQNSPADNDMILANVFISKTSTGCETKQDASNRADVPMHNTSEKLRQKKRYSDDDLFKPRPVLGGISRRRRGDNYSE